MATEGKKRKSGKFCVAGGPGLVSCKNTTYTEGISMHLFPKNVTIRSQWEQFVRKHRPNFKATNVSVLCSVHFEQSCFQRVLNFGDAKQRRCLNKDAVPTIDLVLPSPLQGEEQSERERRQIVRNAIKDVGRHDPKPCSSKSLEMMPSEVVPEQENDHPGDITVVMSDTLSTNVPLLIGGESTTPVTPVNFAATAAIDMPGECMQCEKLKNSLRKYQKEKSRLKRVNMKLRAEIKSKHDTTASSESDDGDKENDDDNNDNGGAGDADKAAVLEEELKEYLLEDVEQHAALPDNDDADWGSCSYQTETSSATADDDEGTEGHNYERVQVDPDTRVEDEPKFIAFYSKLLGLFSLFCFLCRKGNPKVSVSRSGTMAIFTQRCKECGRSFQWRSQPLVLGKYPAGNILLSFGILMAGASVSRVLLVLKHMGLAVFSLRTYFLHQKKFLFPVVLHYWEEYRGKLLDQLKGISGAVWSGDGRFDSMGHCAKYGTYTMFSCDLMKIVHFDILQANQTGSSQAMELQGAKNCFTFLSSAGVAIAVFISDRHRGIAKWIRESQTNTTHLFDIWHVARSVVKKLLKASKEKGYELIKEWIKGVRNHLYWCTTSSTQGFQEMIVAKWRSFMRHVCNKHKDHPDSLFKECAHDDDIEPRKWMKIGSKVYEKVAGILTNTQLLNDIKKLSNDAQTSCLEGYHATLNFWHPKMICFSWMGTYCRHIIASLHFNENLKRGSKTTEDGRTYTHVTYPKFKQGEEVVREIGVPPTYGYVSEIKKLLFSLPVQTMSSVMARYNENVPEPLNRQFPERLSRDEAIENQRGRKRARTELFPSGEEQAVLQTEQQSQSSAPPPSKTPRTCGTCGKPRRGHPRSGCPYALDVVVEQSSSETE